MGQYNPVLLSGAGRGDGGRRVSQKKELLLRMLNVRISVVENKVAKIIFTSEPPRQKERRRL
jgi:hypothetical protein